MRTRDWPIRSKLTALVIVPVTALLALWIFATTLTFGPALDLLAARTYLYDLGRPGEAVVAELQRERRLTVVQLAGTTALPALAEQRQRTDRAVQELRSRVDGEELRDAADAALESRIDRLVEGLDALPAGREFIDQRKMDRAGAFGLYSGVISSAFQAFTGMAALPEPDLNREALALTALGRSRELLGQADTLLAGALTAGRFGEGEHTRLVQIIGNQRLLAEDAVADLPAADRTAYQRLTEGQAFARLRTMQDTLLAADRSASPPVDPAAWQASYDAAQQELREFELAAADGLADRSVPTAVRVLVRLAAAGLLGLIAVVASVLVAVQVGRSLARRLSGVRTAAQDLAEQRLPDVVTRLRRGEHVDVAREAPPLEYGNDEIGQVGRAFTEVQRTAIQSAVDEVTLRRGLNEVFLNIARRSQGLVHRQLALLDRMERGTEDPDELAELFQVDHLATRLRRHAEDLVILAGAAPGRGWRNPVAMVDLARGAISEVEAYDRVDITTVQPAGVLGRAVGDVIHLLAELIENATAFSPPATRVVITGQRVANGYALEITDQGLGMSEAAIEAANRRLTRSPEFDPAESARLGLFVVARLAARHGVKVSLRRSEPTGVIAVVLVPGDLITDEPAPLGLDLPAGRGPARPDRRLARGARRSTVPRPRAAAAGRGATGHPAVGGSAVANGTVEPNGTGAGRGRPDAAGADVPAGSEVAGEIDGLPRRVRRRTPGTGAARPTIADQPTPRAPEEVRRIMSALQSGTARGRQAAEEAGPTPPPAARANGAVPANGPDANGAVPSSGGGTGGADAEGGVAPAGDDSIRPPDAPAATEPSTETERDA
ncbi:nitrate- and nitrite sensing domain-containing protein [Micromonospora krabiensis]|uniref:histidine kinase n=1 Tax=Micromonospora krabiensis TaxID=307121 RepID=A0A1C3NBN9_9ACTN|nr:nitrate- and nitrite sensing domain-containing protein [Micromonospora krabiensis]SBV29963.1 Signal transduction histidine kinase [Micromonospora krabiensis]